MASALLPLASLAVGKELFLGTPEEILKTGLFPEGEALGHLGCGAKPRGYRGQQELRAALLEQRDIVTAPGHALPALRGGRRSCASDTLEGMWSCVLAGSRRTPLGEVRRQVQLAQFNACVGRGWSSAVLGARHANANRAMMMSPTAGGRAGVACPHRLHTLNPDRLEATTGGGRARGALDGHEEGAGSSSTTEPVWWWVLCPTRPLPLWKPLRGHLLHQYEPS